MQRYEERNAFISVFAVVAFIPHRIRVLFAFYLKELLKDLRLIHVCVFALSLFLCLGGHNEEV